MSVLDELQKFGTPKEEIALLRMKLECVESKCEKLRDQLRQEREQGNIQGGAPKKKVGWF